MKCLIINGSPSTKYVWNGQTVGSFTAELVEEVKTAMSKIAALNIIEYTEIRLADENLPYCKGCYNCFNIGENSCPHAAQVQNIMKQMDEADCLILTSPVYALNVSGLIKNFFDLTAYKFHRPSFWDKKAVVISSTAGGGAKSNTKYMSETLRHWGFNKVYTLPVTRHGAVELTDSMKAKCDKIGAALYSDASSGKLYAPKLYDVIFYQIWRVMSTALTSSEVDRTYWEENGLVTQVYAPEIPLGVGTRTVGNLFHKMMSKFIK
ncbi:MAG: flavodoxin family protein [Clostridiales Family XIII bacterium]|jgi:multimeric flavodoxin WrbA|nr:flavodoxin family protein [Clostridiales Family XIII bacterium]